MFKKNIYNIFLSIFVAILGVALGTLPYFSVATIINNIVNNNTDIGNYLPYLLIVLMGLLGNILFHEISTIISHNIAYRIIEDKRKLLAEKLSRISMGDVEKKVAVNGHSSW